MQIPALSKIVINIGVGDATQDSKKLEEAVSELTLISGQKPIITKDMLAVSLDSRKRLLPSLKAKQSTYSKNKAVHLFKL